MLSPEQLSRKLRERWPFTATMVPAVSFTAGVVFDLMTLGRIDEWRNIIQLGCYLAIVMTLIALEVIELSHRITPLPALARFWHYREEVCHFFLGSLLSAFTVFFLKSSSIWGALAFYIMIALCLLGNEMSAVRRVGLSFRLVLASLCLISYLACVVPVFWGEVGVWPFVASVSLASLIFMAFSALIGAILRDQRRALRLTMPPYGLVAGLMLALYFLRLIPPVPLSLTKVGIYRSVERAPGSYVVTYTKAKWRFWESGDQTFKFRAGDRIYCFFSIFSPSGFKDKVAVRWLMHQNGSWQESDLMQVSITGGRINGYRGFAYKQNIEIGRWQVRIETSDQREIGRINLDVLADQSSSERVLTTEVY